MKRIAKFYSIIILIFVFMLASLICLLLSRNLWSFRKSCSRLQQRFCVWALRVLDVRVGQIKQEGFNNKKNYLIVSNHLSYIDILVINSVMPSCFVTSHEIRESNGLGLLTKVAGCIFVERRNRLKLDVEIDELTKALNLGINVCVFPEATSTNGERVLPFKRSLFKASINARTSVLPVTLNYTSIGGEQITPNNRDLIFWYGEMSFLPHLWNLCGLGQIDCRLEFHRSIDVHDNTCSTLISEFAWDRVSSGYFSVVNTPRSREIAIFI